MLRNKRIISPIDDNNFKGGDFSSDSILQACMRMNTATMSTPTALYGGQLYINSQSLGYYDYCIRKGEVTIDSTTDMTTLFTTNQDNYSSFIVVDGNLTINSGTLIPAVRKLFTTIYVTGDLLISGTISMKARGSNHSGSGSSLGAVTATAIRIATGTFSSISNPEIPSAGGVGGSQKARTTTGNSSGNDGTAGSAGGTGGGGSGAVRSAADASLHSGAGAAGTSFSGGASGASAYGSTSGGDAGINGGRGGDDAANRCNPGTGNPHGTETDGTDGQDGTGGVLIIICAGVLSGSGIITAGGVRGAQDQADGNWTGSGGSGGGSITVMYGTDSSSITPTATGGAGGTSGGGAAGVTGGAGGDGTARKLALGSL
jgi:hypothetical protein